MTRVQKSPVIEPGTHSDLTPPPIQVSKAKLLLPRFREFALGWPGFVACCAIFLLQAWLSSPKLSQTADEATHLLSGYRILKCSDLSLSPEHPPLAKVVAALPLLAQNVPVDCGVFPDDDFGQSLYANQWLYSGSNWRKELLSARVAASSFAALLCLSVWLLSRKLFGPETALVAVLILAFEPNFLASSAQVMTDMAVTAMIPLAVYACYLCFEKRTLPWVVFAGVCTGLTLFSKASGLVIVPIILLWAAVYSLWAEEKQDRWPFAARNLGLVMSIFAVAYLMLWIGYGMRYSIQATPIAPSEEIMDLARRTNSHTALLWMGQHHLLPEGYLRGINFMLAKVHDTAAYPTHHPFGQYGSWNGLFLQVCVRSTVAFLAMFLMAMVAGIAPWLRIRLIQFFAVAIPAALLVAACSRSSLDAGIRYALPSLPFVLILTAWGCVNLWQRYRWMRYVLPCLLVLHGASSLWAFPNYLSYANEMWGGPSKAYKVSLTDTGQGYEQVRLYRQKHPEDPCYLITDWQWDPRFYGINCQAYGVPWNNELIPERLHGMVIVSTRMMDDEDIVRYESTAPFRQSQPVDEIAGSAMLVYKGDFDTRALAAMDASIWAFLKEKHQDWDESLRLLDYAIPTYPGPCHGVFYARVRRAQILVKYGRLADVLTDLEEARKVARTIHTVADVDIKWLDRQIQLVKNALSLALPEKR